MKVLINKYYHLFFIITACFNEIFAQKSLTIQADSLLFSGKVFQINKNGIVVNQHVPNPGGSATLHTGNSAYQTFLAGKTGLFTQVNITFYCHCTQSQNAILKIFQGEGTQGLELLSQNIEEKDGMNSYLFSSPIPIIADQVYTIFLSNAFFSAVNYDQVYTRGYFSLDNDSDLIFTTFVTANFGIEIDSTGNINSKGIITGDGSGITNIKQSNIGGPFNGPAQLLKLDGGGNLSLLNHGILARNSFGQVEIGFPSNNNSSMELKNFNGGTPFIDFANDAASDFDARFILAGDENLQLHGANLQVLNGIVSAQSFTSTSDGRFKKDFTDLQNPLDKVLNMKGLHYFWRQNEFSEKKFNSEKQIGFIAQDLEKIVPEVVFTDEKGYKSVDYSKVVPLLVEAFKEQNLLLMEIKKEFEMQKKTK